ncbi:MAG: helix-turn-helix transcriptional regulator [Methylococcales bacterium]
MSVNEKIRLICEAKGLTQEQVAEKLKISVNSYGDIERGNTNVKLARLEQIAQLFEIKLSDLFELTEKGTLNIYFSGCEQNENNKLYIGSSSTELEKLELIVELKDKEIAMQQRENENLKVQIAQLQKINTLLEQN